MLEVVDFTGQNYSSHILPQLHDTNAWKSTYTLTLIVFISCRQDIETEQSKAV